MSSDLNEIGQMAGPGPLEINGNHTGLRLEVGGKRVCYTTFEDKVGCLTRDQIAKILSDSRRVSAREEFNSSWVLSQGRRNSCAGYAIGSMLEKLFKRQFGIRYKLAPEYVYAKANGGRDQGALLRRVVEEAFNGCALREHVPYEAYRKSEMGPESHMSASRFKLAEGEVVGIHSDDELASAIALNWLVLVAVHVDERQWFRLDGNGVVAETLGVGNHAIHVDDVRINAKGQFEYDHQGSWGTTYGQQGRGYITWSSHLREPVKHHEFVACRAMLPDPETTKIPQPK